MPKIKTDLLKVKDSDGKWQYIPTVRSEGKSATNDESVLYVPQTLLDEQKRQARKNIGAVGADELETAVSDKIDSPETAVIGEMLSVAEIDENGKPKKWKTEKVEISNVETDSTLTVSGKAADAKAVGDELKNKQPVGNYLTGEADPTVPAWAKQPNKPTYTADEVGALSKDTVIPTVPTALPNPNKLKFTGAVSAEYDGSNAVTVNIPNGGSAGNNDNSLGLTGVNVGDIPKVKAVDENGRPTEWDIANYGAGDSSGGSGGFKLINKIALEEQTDRVEITTDSSGNPFELSEVYLLCNTKTYESTAQTPTFLPNGGWTSKDAYLTSSHGTSKNEDGWYTRHYFHSVYCDGVMLTEELPQKDSNIRLDSVAKDTQKIITNVSVACKFAAGCDFTLIGR